VRFCHDWGLMINEKGQSKPWFIKFTETKSPGTFVLGARDSWSQKPLVHHPCPFDVAGSGGLSALQAPQQGPGIAPASPQQRPSNNPLAADHTPDHTPDPPESLNTPLIIIVPQRSGGIIAPDVAFVGSGGSGVGAVPLGRCRGAAGVLLGRWAAARFLRESCQVAGSSDALTRLGTRMVHEWFLASSFYLPLGPVVSHSPLYQGLLCHARFEPLGEKPRGYPGGYPRANPRGSPSSGGPWG
jgi:hypothetical protein